MFLKRESHFKIVISNLQIFWWPNEFIWILEVKLFVCLKILRLWFRHDAYNSKKIWKEFVVD